MKPGLFILPFLALFVGALGSITAKSFPNLAWTNYAGWGAAAAIIGLWISLDYEGFKRAVLRKGAKYGASSFAVVVLGVLVIVGLAFLSSKPTFNKSKDFSKSKSNTLADQSIKMVENLKEKNLKVQVVALFVDPNQKQAFSDLIERYAKIADVFTVEYFNPKEDPGKAGEYNITSENTVIFRNGNQEARVSSFSEEKVTNAIAKIQKERGKKVYFTKGHGESPSKSQDPKAYGLAVAELENNKFEVAEISLLEKPEIPTDADLVIIGGPKYDISSAEAGQIEQYLKNGGALLVMTDALTHLPELFGLLAKCGVTVNEDMLIVPPGDPRAMVYGQTIAFITKFDENHAATRDFARQGGTTLFFPNARTLTVNDSNPLSLKGTLVAKTGGDIVNVKGVKSLKDLNKIAPGQVAQGEFGVVAAAVGKASAESKKDIRVAVTGSSQFLYDSIAGSASQNLDVFMNLANYLVQEEDFIAIKPKEVTAGVLDLSSGLSQLSLFGFSFLYPLLFLGSGIIYWLNRRKA